MDDMNKDKDKTQDKGKDKAKGKEKTKPLCTKCQKENAVKLFQCDGCRKFFHVTCTKFHMTHNGTVSERMCSLCLFELNSPIARRTRFGSTSSAPSSRPGSPVGNPSDFAFQSRPLPPSSTPGVSESGPLQTDVSLQQLGIDASGGVVGAAAPSAKMLAEILEKLNSMDARSRAYERKMETKMVNFQDDVTSKLAALDKLPSLIQTVDTVVADVASLGDRFTNMEVEQRKLRATVDNLKSSGAAGVSDEVTARIEKAEESMKEVAGAVALINAERAKVSSDLIVSGLYVPEEADLKQLVLAVLHELNQSFQLGNIVSVRFLKSKLAGAAAAVEGASLHPGGGEVSNRPVSLLVRVSSSELARSLVVAKIRHGKLHTASLNADLVVASGATLPLRESLININEFLPQDLYNLRCAVRDAARGKGYTTFVNDGSVFIKKKKTDVPTCITSMADLKNFLLGS